MSKPYSPSTNPEFTERPDYSDVLGMAPAPTQPARIESDERLSGKAAKVENSSHRSDVFVDPWASDDIAASQSAPLPRAPSGAVIDPWASDPATEPQPSLQSKQSPQSKQSSVGATPASRVSIDRQQRQTSSLAVDLPPVGKVAVVPPQPPARSVVTPIPETPAKAAEIDRATPALTGKDLAIQYCERGRKSLEAKDYAQARSAYKIAIEWQPQLATAHSGMAQICYQIQDYEGALSAWDVAIGCDATQIDFYYQRALVNKTLKNYYQVLVDCKYVLERDPERHSARWLNAVALVKIENYQVALFDLDRHITTYPQDPNGYCYRGICYERLEQLPQALADFDRSIAIQPHQPVFHHARGRTRHQLGDLQGALTDFNLTIERKPQAAVYDNRAEVHRCLGNHLEALHDCDRAIELNPKSIDTYFRRGLTYTELGNLDLALANYTQTIELDPHHIQAWIQRSWIYFRQKDYPRAKLDCQAVNAFDRSCFWSHYLLGLVNSRSGLKHNAIKSFSQAIEISSNYVSARYHRGLIHHEMGDIAKAMADFEQARSIQDLRLERMVDRDETGFYAEGMALYHLGQPEAARTVLLLGALAAKRFNNTSFHQLILSSIEELGMASGELSSSASNSCTLKDRG
jgi:tetratricopeptide (TPR) repeat protein